MVRIIRQRWRARYCWRPRWCPGTDPCIAVAWCLGFMVIAIWLITVVFPRKTAR